MLEKKMGNKEDSLQITRYLIDKMGDDSLKVCGWLSMLGDVCDEEVSEYGMSMGVLNSMGVWDNRFNLINCKG